MNVPAEMVDDFVAKLADELAPRIGDALVAATVASDDWRLLDVEEAASRLGRSTRWVRERAKRGDLPFVRLDGGALAFELDDLRTFAARRRVSAEDEESLASRLRLLGNPASQAGSRVLDRVDNRKVAP